MCDIGEQMAVNRVFENFSHLFQIIPKGQHIQIISLTKDNIDKYRNVYYLIYYQ